MQLKLILLFGLISACMPVKNENTYTGFEDTVNILNAVFKNKEFNKGVTPQTQTLLVVKNKYYRNNWPQKLGAFNIVYVSKDTTSLNHFRFPAEEQHYYEVSYLALKKDTALINIIYLNRKSMLNYRLVKEKGIWKIISS